MATVSYVQKLNGEDKTGSAGSSFRQLGEDLLRVAEIKRSEEIAPVPLPEPAGENATPAVPEIYRALEVSPALSSALRLLDDAMRHADEALRAAADDNPVVADDEIQIVNGILPELFCCRRLGDGFGAIVNAIRIALTQRAGRPLERGQIIVVAGALRRLKAKPYIVFDEAIDVIAGMEDAGLEVESLGLSLVGSEDDE